MLWAARGETFEVAMIFNACSRSSASISDSCETEGDPSDWDGELGMERVQRESLTDQGRRMPEVSAGVETITYRSSMTLIFPLHCTMDPNQNTKFPLHEAAREGRSMCLLQVAYGI